MFVFASADMQEVQKLAESGNIDAQISVAYSYAEAGNFRSALKWYQRAAEKGDPRAMNSLGLLYAQGWGVRQDYQKAVSYFRKGVRVGFAKSMTSLGEMYLKGYGVPVDTKKAIALFEQAAAQNEPMSYFNLGGVYKDGLGVKPDFKKAVYYYSKAARLGKINAYIKVASMYENGGPNLNKNYVEAYKWYELASVQGFTEAKNALQILKQKMTAAQIQQGEKLYQDYLNG